MLLYATLAHASDTFHPDEGDDLLSYGDLLTAGLVTGRTGRVMVSGEVPELPEIVAVRVLPGGVSVVTPAPGVDDLALARRLHAGGWAVPDLILPVRAAGVPDDPLVVDQWHLENTGQGGRTPGIDIDAAAAWDLATGAGVTIAVLDSGVQLDHPDLRVTGGYDYAADDEDANPDPADRYSAGHGTSVAGVAAGAGNDAYGVAGVAWDAEVYAVRIIGGSSSLEDIYTAFVEAVDAGAGVLSNSWGFDDCGTIPSYGTFGEMLRYAEDEGRGGLGAVVVFAAGNESCDITGSGLLDRDKVVAVAAIESNDRRASYSNYGAPLDISAPTSLLTTDMVGGGYGSYAGDDAFVDGFGGTSAAAPVVSGVVALMLEANPRLTAEQVREALCVTASRNDVANGEWDSSGWSPWYGCGRVDAGAAVAFVADTEPAAPVPTLVAEEVWEERVLLAWEAAEDPDGDVVGYEVEWGETRETGGLSIDLTGEVQAGDTITWQVRAIDPWGAGPWSDPVTFSVVAKPIPEEEPPPATPAEDGGCSHAPLVLPWLVLLRRRRC